MGINRYPGNVITSDANTPTVTSASGTWTLEEAYQNIGNWPMAQSQIQNSLRFNSADSAYLNRTPASAGNRKTWTWSGWVKRSALSSTYPLFMAGSASTDYTILAFNSNDVLYIANIASSANAGRKFSSAVYRDVSAWYHVVAVFDTDNATANDRMILYVNGSRITALSVDENPSSGQAGQVNNNVIHTIGRNSTNTVQYFNGYLANINFIDGLALDADYFGFTDANGIWQPKQYKGAYGTNGFYLDFLESDVLYSTTTGGKFSTTGPTSIFRSLGNDSSAYFSGMTISGDFDFYWTYGTGSGSLTPGDAYIVGVVAASYQASFNYDNAYIGGASSTLFYTLYGSGGFYTRGYVNGTQTDASTSSDNPGTTTYVRMTRSGSTLYVYQGTPGSWTLKKTFTGTFSGDLYFFVGSGDKNENISLNNVTFASINGGTRTLTDAGTIAGDASGNGNGWGTANIQTSGSSNDWMVDTPTNYGTDTGVGGEVRGNYCTLNPLDKGTSISTSNGNLEFTVGGANNYEGIRATLGIPQSGKWYWETAYSGLGYISSLGVATSSASVQGTSFSKVRTIGTGSWYNSFNSGVVQYNTDAGPTFGSGGNVNWSGASQPSANDIYMVAVDMDSGKMWIGKNGTWFNSSGTANPATGVDPRWADLAGEVWFPYSTEASSSPITKTFNFGQTPFAYTAPSGFKALCTQNLSTPTILDGADYFNATLWTGNGATQTITTGLANDLVWTKDRGAAYDHTWFDVLRTPGYFLRSNSTSAEEYRADSLTAFTSTGFSVGADSVRQNINKSGNSYVSWAWKAGGTGVSNTDGTNTSAVVSANPTAGFSIVTYTGTGANATVGHGLGVAPKMVIVKQRNGSTYSWTVYNASLTSGYVLALESTSAQFSRPTSFNSTAPTSTVFSLGTDSGTNASGGTYVAYCFAPVAGYSAFGSYTGNGSADGPFVYTGFRPRFVLVKKTSATSSWSILDTARDGYNVSDNPLLPNLSNAESTSTSTSGAFADILSNGFKARGNSGDINDSGATYIYAAFAENPFKLSRAR